MADVTKTTTFRNAASADATVNSGAASQTVVYDRSDEKIVLRVENQDANTATITVPTNGFGGADASDFSFTVAEDEIKYVAVLESMYYKDPATQKVTVTITDADGSAFSGTVTNVTIEVPELPKSLTN